MSLTFAFKWNYNYDDQDTIVVNNARFGYGAAIRVLREACLHTRGASLRDYIDKHNARVINGPHRSDADKKLHMSVLGRVNGITYVCYHICIGPSGIVSDVSSENTKKTGHANDDWHAPMIGNFSQLEKYISTGA